jgi:hypothetical protein
MPSFANPLAAPYCICREWIHIDRAAACVASTSNCFLARCCRNTKASKRSASIPRPRTPARIDWCGPGLRCRARPTPTGNWVIVDHH